MAKNFTYPLREILGKGLAPTKHQPLNIPYLVESTGLYPYEDSLQTLEELINSINNLEAYNFIFPYPQLFLLDEINLVCNKDEIFEFVDGNLDSKISGLPIGTTWSVADYKTFLYLTNGQVAVVRDAQSGVFSITEDIPFAICCCDFNGQLILGGPLIEVGGAI